MSDKIYCCPCAKVQRGTCDCICHKSEKDTRITELTAEVERLKAIQTSSENVNLTRIAELERRNGELEKENGILMNTHSGELDIYVKQANVILSLLSVIKKKDEALRDIANNFDCDSDAHKYRTSCRCCEAKKAISIPVDSSALDKAIKEAEDRTAGRIADYCERVHMKCCTVENHDGCICHGPKIAEFVRRGEWRGK